MSTFYRKPGSPRLISSPNRSLSPRYMRDEEDMDANMRETGNMAGKMKMGVRSRSSNNFKVVIRVRPPLAREMKGPRPFQNVISVDNMEKAITISENLAAVSEEDPVLHPGICGPYGTHIFSFDNVHDQCSSQEDVFNSTARGVVESSLEGYNATIFAYGQTGTGKTYTMEGFPRDKGREDRGIIPRSIELIFDHIKTNASHGTRYLVRASYLQIYNEQISDLLRPERSNLAIREDKKRGVFVEGLSEWVVRSPAEIYGLMEKGRNVRATRSTNLNEMSSRSHAVFIIIVEQSETTYVDASGNDISAEDFSMLMHKHGIRRDQALMKLENHVRQSFKFGKLNLVDLAGSERVRLSGATGQRLEESKKINQSLSALGNVIAALTDVKGRQHIPYRDSKLTRILEDSLGGNCKTTMMAMVSPALESMGESLSTLKFANRAKNIKNEATVNEDLDQKSLLRKYERELKRLKAELNERSQTVVDKRRLLELDEQRRRAEADKMAAIRALEARSLEFLREKEEKRKLEERIQALTSQMIRGERYMQSIESIGMPGEAKSVGKAIEPSEPERMGNPTRDLSRIIKEHQERMRREYDQKMADLEKERESIEEEKAQVDRYKQLLLKQRDIMIALNQRLNERDEQIVQLQDEIDSSVYHQKELEEKLDRKTTELIHLQRVTMEKGMHPNANSDNEDLISALGEWAAAAAAAARSSEKVVNGRGGSSHQAWEEGNEEKSDKQITEMSMLVERSQVEMQKMAEGLEEVRADKISMEDLLRDKLHRLSLRSSPGKSEKEKAPRSRSRVRSRPTNSSESSGNMSEMRRLLRENKERLERSKERERMLVRELSDLRTRPNGTLVAKLKKRCDALSSEREAVLTIINDKIRLLVSNLEHELLVHTPKGTPALSTLQSLKHITDASVAALQNATSADLIRVQELH